MAWVVLSQQPYFAHNSLPLFKLHHFRIHFRNAYSNAGIDKYHRGMLIISLNVPHVESVGSTSMNELTGGLKGSLEAAASLGPFSHLH